MKPVADFYSSFGINVRTNDIRKVDRYLGLVERKMRRFQERTSKNLSLNFSRFSLSQSALRASLGAALDRASKSVTFEISQFAVNDRNMKAALLRSSRRVGREVGQMQGGIRGTTTIVNNYSGGLGRRSAGIMGDGRNLLYAGGGAGLIARQGIGAVPLIGGAYGLSRLNRAHQEIFVAPLTTQAVVQAQGYSEQAGVETFGWLKQQADGIGFSYMDAAPDFNQILSNALGAGLDIEGTQDIFKGFNEYQTAMGITPYRRKLINNAMSQMLGKGTVTQEELRRQMSESLPGTMSIFGEALATLTGSGLTGQAAIEELYRAVEAGEVVSAEILPIVAEVMSRRAQPKLGIMKKSSIAESARVVNAWHELLTRFSEAGGEKGFAAFFRAAAEQLPRLTPLVEGLGAAFYKLGNIVEPVFRMFANYVQIITDVKRSFDEIDPSIAKVAGTLLLLTTRIGRLMLPFTAFYLILEDIAVGLSGGISYTNDLFTFLDRFVSYDKKVLGLTMAVLTLVAAFKLLRGIGSIGLPGGKGDNKEKGGRGRGRGLFGGLLLGGLARGAWSLLSNPYVSVPLGLGGVGYWGYNTDAFQSTLVSSPDKWLNLLAHTAAGAVGYKEQREYWNNIFSSSSRGALVGSDVENLFSSTQRGREWLTSYLEGESKLNPDGTVGKWAPDEREQAFEELATRINEAYSSSRMIREGEYSGPLLWSGGDIASSIPNGPSSYVENINNSSTTNSPTVTNEINITADGVVDPEGLRGMIEGLMPELESVTERALQGILSTTQDAYGG